MYHYQVIHGRARKGQRIRIVLKKPTQDFLMAYFFHKESHLVFLSPAVKQYKSMMNISAKGNPLVTHCLAEIPEVL